MEQFFTVHQPILMWTFCTVFIWFWMIWFRKEAIHGMKGSNLFWENSEQLIYWVIMMMPPIVFKATFMGDVPIYVWYFLASIVIFAFMGRSAADYILSFFGRAPVKDTKTTETTKETVKETTST